MVVISPVMVIAKPLIAPWISPNSNAVAVPEPCEAVPHAKPCDTLSFIFKILNIVGAITAPIIPDKITANTVIEDKPPNSSTTPKASGVIKRFLIDLIIQRFL